MVLSHAKIADGQLDMNSLEVLIGQTRLIETTMEEMSYPSETIVMYGVSEMGW